MVKADDSAANDDVKEGADNVKDQDTTEDKALEDAVDSIADGVKGDVTENPDPLGQTATETDEEGNDDAGEGDEGNDSDGTDGKTDDDAGDKPGEKADTGQAGTGTKTDKTEEEKPEADEAGVYDQKQIDDPGEFKPNDYSFSIKTTDGKTVKISSPEEAEEFANSLDDNPDLINASQFLQFNRKAAAMDMGITNDKEKWEAQKTDYDTRQALEQTRTDAMTEMNNGLNYLVTRGDLQPLPPELNTADVKWEDHTDNQAVKQRLDLLKFMETENEARIAAGLKPSFDLVATHRSWQLEQMTKTAQDQDTKDKQTRQKRGSLVKSRSAHQQIGETKNAIIGEGGTLDDMVNDFYLGNLD